MRVRLHAQSPPGLRACPLARAKSSAALCVCACTREVLRGSVRVRLHARSPPGLRVCPLARTKSSGAACVSAPPRCSRRPPSRSREGVPVARKHSVWPRLAQAFRRRRVTSANLTIPPAAVGVHGGTPRHGSEEAPSEARPDRIESSLTRKDTLSPYLFPTSTPRDAKPKNKARSQLLLRPALQKHAHQDSNLGPLD